jgi:hypothetical protein
MADGRRIEDRRMDQVIDRLPKRAASMIRWLRRPSSRWLRIPVGLLLIVGGFLAVLPVFGLWMLPLGLILLAEDVPALRRMRDRMLDRLAGGRRREDGDGKRAPPVPPC